MRTLTLMLRAANAVYLYPLLFVLSVSLSPSFLLAQTTPAKTPAADTSSGTGFSIQTEMLTYRALESNSEAIVCDVIAYLSNTSATSASFRSSGAGAVCNIGVVKSAPTGGIVILPFDRSVFTNFQIWRADMQTMADIENHVVCSLATPAVQPPAPASDPSEKPPVVRGSSGASSLFDSTPVGEAATTAASVFALFATTQTVSSVAGTIQDQALMDNVSRGLRALNMPVFMPSVYTPYDLTSIDRAKSPFLNALDKLLSTRDCLLLHNAATDPNLKLIEDFLTRLSGSTIPVKPVTGSSANPNGDATTPSNTTSTTSHLEAVLSADGFARSLGADATGRIPDPAAKHLLLLKALESGGSVSRVTNIFRTKIDYSGGAVDTYALFNLNGQLECSGNVYDYAGSIPSGKFNERLRTYKTDPSTQVIIQTGGCRSQ